MDARKNPELPYTPWRAKMGPGVWYVLGKGGSVSDPARIVLATCSAETIARAIAELPKLQLQLNTARWSLETLCRENRELLEACKELYEFAGMEAFVDDERRAIWAENLAEKWAEKYTAMMTKAEAAIERVEKEGT